LRRYVELYPDTYGQVLQCRPGVAGLASIYFHAHESYLVRDGGDSETNEPRVQARVLRRQLFVAGFDDVAVVGERASTFIVGTERVLTRGKWGTVEILACPVTFSPASPPDRGGTPRV
jgi:hypothetical protein